MKTASGLLDVDVSFCFLIACHFPDIFHGCIVMFLSCPSVEMEA